MEITVTIPDNFAAQVVAHGLMPRGYVETLIAEQTRTDSLQAIRQNRLANLESFFEEMAVHSDKVPAVTDEALTRESFYRDHD